MRTIPTGKWIYNDSDTEVWYGYDEYSSKEKAIDAGMEYYLGDPFYVGQEYEVQFELSDGYGICDFVMEEIADRLYDEAGEVAEDFVSNITPEESCRLDEKLAEVVLDWLKEINLPTYFKVDDIEKVEL